MPRSCSCGSRSVLRPVSASTSVVFPWSMCPAVPIVSGMRWTLATAVVLAAAAGYDVVLAFGWVGLGDVPGADAPGAQACFFVALAAMVVGAALSLRGASPALAPAAALFLVAFEYSFDPYYAPSRRRYAEGIVSPTWMFALLAVSIVPAVLARRHGVPTSLFLAVAGLTLFVTPAGH